MDCWLFAKLSLILQLKQIIMTLHCFNPEHDIALAANLSNFTAPHAGRQLRYDLGWLPALWAADGDAIFVDEISYSETAWRRFRQCAHLGNDHRRLTFADKRMLEKLPVASVKPWGWDPALRSQLQRLGVRPDILPSEAQTDQIRNCSSRQLSCRLLPLLRKAGTIGESFVCRDEEEVEQLLSRYGQLVLKAPWSSSGRGLRFLHDQHAGLSIHAGWLRNILKSQGIVMAEPYYNKVKDFGLEFHVDKENHVSFLGLSLFHTKNGAYTGNIIATENHKREHLGKFISLQLVDEVASDICSLTEQLLGGCYQGPFGVDMMVVAGNHDDHHSFLLHPCVELNLRRTMGHVALELARWCNPTCDDDLVKVMRIELTDHYQLKINRL